ncbi:MAG: site-specific integrase [Roseburia sp.]|nr:site-specific integrase [Roseburia sp.]
MVKGRLQIKKGYYYAVLTYKKTNGKRKEIWRATGVKTYENKKKAELICEEYREQLAVELRLLSTNNYIIKDRFQKLLLNYNDKTLFGDYMEKWLEIIANKIESSTFSSYQYTVVRRIKPYFNNLGISLTKITTLDLSLFYSYCINDVKANTVKHYHAIIHQALKFAVENDLVAFNIAEKVRLPKVQEFIGQYYNREELIKLFESVRGKRIEFAVLMGAYYGLRRSEIVGLKWTAIDFTYKTISIRHTVTEYSIDGKIVREGKDGAKSRNSIRTLPLLSEIERYLLSLKETQAQNKLFFGINYCADYEEYIYVDQIGKLIKPGFITQNFHKTLRDFGMRIIRFQDLRHSCATLLRHQGARMEDVQKWLGHSSIAITEKIYSHFENWEHIKTAKLVEEALKPL